MLRETMIQLEHAIRKMESTQQSLRQWQFQHVHDHLSQLKGELEWIREQERKFEKDQR